MLTPEQEMLQEIQSSIEKSLPSMQVNVFRRHMDDFEKMKKEYADLKAKYDILSEKSKIDSNELGTLRALQLNAGTIASEKQALELEKLKFDITKKLQEASVSHANDKTGAVMSVVNSVFRNMEVRKRIFGDVPLVNTDSQGNRWTTTTPTNIDQTETAE
jgi:hypothetical protein